MTFMPNFEQPASSTSDESHANHEAELLKQKSRYGLSRLFVSRLFVRQDLADVKSIYKARLDAELEIIEQLGFCGYFLIVADYVQWAKDSGIAVGPGRGSGPCSLVGFALGITNIDPIKYGLPFERFINPILGMVPDFDLDFCAERRTVRPDCFEELCAVIALCYPSLEGITPQYVERSNKLHKNPIRRRQSGAVHSGMSNVESTGLFEYLCLAGRNTFNKSHAVAFAMIAYQTAWLKANT